MKSAIYNHWCVNVDLWATDGTLNHPTSKDSKLRAGKYVSVHTEASGVM